MPYSLYIIPPILIAKDLSKNYYTNVSFAVRIEKSLMKLTALPNGRTTIIDVNDFIGNNLAKRLVACGNFEVHAIDFESDRLESLLPETDFSF